MRRNIFIFITIGIFVGLIGTYFYYRDNGKETIKEEILTFDLYDEYYLKVKTLFDSVNLNSKEYGIVKSDEVLVSDLSNQEKNNIIGTYAYNKDLFDKEKFTFTKFDLLSLEIFGNTIDKEDSIDTYDGFVISVNEKKKIYDLSYKLVEYIEYKSLIMDNIRGAYKYGDTIYFDVPITFYKTNNNEISYSNDPFFENIYCKGYDCVNKLKYKVYRVTFKYDKSDSKYKFLSSKVMVS